MAIKLHFKEFILLSQNCKKLPNGGQEYCMKDVSSKRTADYFTTEYTVSVKLNLHLNRRTVLSFMCTEKEVLLKFSRNDEF